MTSKRVCHLLTHFGHGQPGADYYVFVTVGTRQQYDSTPACEAAATTP